MDKNNKSYHKITVADMAPHVHKFLPNENKTEKILNWLENWIILSLECGKIHPFDLLPSKADLACHIGVSQGTIQNAIRLLENKGLLESKQRIGTYIKDSKNNNTAKLTSKREFAVEIIKKYIYENNYAIGDVLISARKIAQQTGISNATIRLAMTSLIQEGILAKKGSNYIINNLGYKIELIALKTLSEKIADSIKNYIQTKLKSGDRVPTNSEFAKMFNVSIKTVHDAIKHLTKEGLLYIRRGQYGTIVTNDSDSNNETYLYLKYEQKLRQYIAENHEIGNKLPTIKEFANLYNTSEKTIKKSLDNLAEEGYVTYVRGRYGGTFVTDIPQISGEAYKWLAINADYISN